MKVKIKTLTCKRCNHSWKPRNLDVRQCPKCKSAYWEKEKTKQDGQ